FRSHPHHTSSGPHLTPFRPHLTPVSGPHLTPVPVRISHQFGPHLTPVPARISHQFQSRISHQFRSASHTSSGPHSHTSSGPHLTHPVRISTSSVRFHTVSGPHLTQFSRIHTSSGPHLTPVPARIFTQFRSRISTPVPGPHPQADSHLLDPRRRHPSDPQSASVSGESWLSQSLSSDRQGQWLRRRKIDGRPQPRAGRLLPPRLAPDRVHGGPQHQWSRDRAAPDQGDDGRRGEVRPAGGGGHHGGAGAGVRQLLVEALSLLVRLPDLDLHRCIDLRRVLHVEQLVTEANRLFLADQAAHGGDATSCCAGSHDKRLACGGANGVCAHFYDSAPSGRRSWGLPKPQRETVKASGPSRASSSRRTFRMANAAGGTGQAAGVWWDLNVGGSHFSCSRATLCSEPGSRLSEWFSGDPAKHLPADSAGRFFIDRDGPAFGQLLNYLRDRPAGFHLPAGFSAAAAVCARRAAFYGLQGAVAALERAARRLRPAASPYRGTFAFGRDGLADVKFRKLTRILVAGRVSVCRAVRDPDRGQEDRYTSRFFLKHSVLEQAFEMLYDAGFSMVGSCGSGTKSSMTDVKPGQDNEETKWQHYNEFVFVAGKRSSRGYRRETGEEAMTPIATVQVSDRVLESDSPPPGFIALGFSSSARRDSAGQTP
uniref:BTB_2 domain-containing protein n=1 Tax=Macrostomum lignano TaxID=282301 RepID=A0A1I8JPS5_9PLAT